MRRRAAAENCKCGHWEETHGVRLGECRVIGCNCKQMVAAAKQKRSKYGAIKCVGQLGELYDSMAERKYAHVLERRRTVAGSQIISRWSWAPRFVLQDDPLITYRPDFIFWTRDGRPRVVDVKGHAARDFSLRVRLWKSRYPDVPLCVVRDGIEEWQ